MGHDQDTVHGAALPFEDLESGEAPVAEAVGDPTLVGTACDDCGASLFPPRFVCSVCGSRRVTRAHLGNRGSLYSYCTVEITSGRQVPYTLGYVDLFEGPRVLARIEAEPEALDLGIVVGLGVGGGDWWFAPHEEDQPA